MGLLQLVQKEHANGHSATCTERTCKWALCSHSTTPLTDLEFHSIGLISDYTLRRAHFICHTVLVLINSVCKFYITLF